MYRSYRDAVDPALRAVELDRRLTTERLRRGSGLDRGHDRKTWRADLASLPDGTVIIGADGQARLVLADRMLAFSFGGWKRPEVRTVTFASVPRLTLFLGGLEEWKRLVHSRFSGRSSRPSSCVPPQFSLAESYLTGALFPQMLLRTERPGCHAT